MLDFPLSKMTTLPFLFCWQVHLPFLPPPPSKSFVVYFIRKTEAAWITALLATHLHLLSSASVALPPTQKWFLLLFAAPKGSHILLVYNLSFSVSPVVCSTNFPVSSGSFSIAAYLLINSHPKKINKSLLLISHSVVISIIHESINKYNWKKKVFSWKV